MCCNTRSYHKVPKKMLNGRTPPMMQHLQNANEYFPRLAPALPVSYIRLFLWLATEHSSVRVAHHSDLCGRLFMTVLDALKADHDEAEEPAQDHSCEQGRQEAGPNSSSSSKPN